MTSTSRPRPGGYRLQSAQLAPIDRVAPLPGLRSAFAQRRAIFGPHDLREDRIRAESYLAEDLSPAARRDLRVGGAE